MRRKTPTRTDHLMLVVAMLLTACGTPPPEEEAAVVLPRVENEALGIAIAALIPAYEVATNQGSELVLASTGGGPPTTVRFEVSEATPRSLNLMAARDDFIAGIEERGGIYKGKAELITHLGNAFFARGRFPAAGMEDEAESGEAEGAEEEETGDPVGGDGTEGGVVDGTEGDGAPAADSGEFDEMVIFLLHPWGDRQLRLHYRGPAADGDEGKARFAELTEVLGEVEGLPAPSEPASNPL